MPLSPDKLTNMLVASILKNDEGGIGSVVSMGADPNRSDAKGNSPLTIAATDPREHGALKALLAAKANPNFASVNGKLPLHAVLRMKDDRNMLAAVEILLAAGANPNLIEGRPGELPVTPLQVALMQSRSDKIVEKLLRTGADAGAGENATVGLLCPLHMMAQGRYAMLETAYMCGANLNKPDFKGRTCLMWAARTGAVRTVETLLECKADPTLKDMEGLDAMAHARAAPPDVDFRPLVKAMMAASNDHGIRKEIQDLRTEIEIIKRALAARPA